MVYISEKKNEVSCTTVFVNIAREAMYWINTNFK